jgi:hypothetical protein
MDRALGHIRYPCRRSNCGDNVGGGRLCNGDESPGTTYLFTGLLFSHELFQAENYLYISNLQNDSSTDSQVSLIFILSNLR